MRTRPRLLVAAALLAVAGLTAACVPDSPGGGGGPTTKNWKFGGTEVTVIDSQDETLGVCWPAVLCQDEPYLLTVNFRVKIGEPNSAQTWIVNDRTNAPENVPEGGTRYVNTHFPPSAGGEARFNDVKALDLFDLLDESNKLEVFGSYVWVSEEDQVGNGAAAQSTANVMRDALNATLATADLESLDASFILDLIMGNLGGAFMILVQNIPLFGLGDDVMGGGMYVGIGATGTLGSALDATIGTTPFPTFDTPVEIPPSVTGGGFYTLTGPKTFTQTVTGRGGTHRWVMQTGPA